MSQAWKVIFKEYVECYNAIQLLTRKGIFDEEEKNVHEHNLLFEIIVTMQAETEG